MEESQKLISISPNISPHLLLNLHNNYINPCKPQSIKSYFSTVQKYQEKEKQLVQEGKKKHGFVQKFYQKLKKQMQNSTDQKTLKENLSLMNICLKHKHSRINSQTLPTTTTAQTNRKKIDLFAVTTRRQLPTRVYQKQLNNNNSISNMFYCKTNRIIAQCDEQNRDMTRINRKMGLFNYYNSKLSRKFNNSQLRIKKTQIQY